MGMQGVDHPAKERRHIGMWSNGLRRRSDTSETAVRLCPSQLKVVLIYVLNRHKMLFMKRVQEPTYEARIYIGSKREYEGEEFTFEELRSFIAKYQDREVTCPLRITETHFMFQDYLEKGWEIAVINYPRFPKDPRELERFVVGLADSLMYEFKQNRISVVCPERTYMFEANEAKQTHCCEND